MKEVLTRTARVCSDQLSPDVKSEEYTGDRTVECEDLSCASVSPWEDC